MYDFLLVRHCNYSSVFILVLSASNTFTKFQWYHVPFASYLTLNNTATLKCGSKSLKVIEADAIQKLGCGFLFAFYSNSSRISVAVCEIFSVKEWCELENGVRVRSRSLEMARFDRPCMNFY